MDAFGVHVLARDVTVDLVGGRIDFLFQNAHHVAEAHALPCRTVEQGERGPVGVDSKVVEAIRGVHRMMTIMMIIVIGVAIMMA